MCSFPFRILSMIVTRTTFLENRHGRTFSDVVNDPNVDFEDVLAFFNDPQRQLRMEDAEIHHDRPPLAGVVREFEAQPNISRYLASEPPHKAKRFRQAVGMIVRMIMEGRGWQKTGRKGSLGVRAGVKSGTTQPGSYHNSGGLAFWFIRAERYERSDGMPFQTVRDMFKEFDAEQQSSRSPKKSSKRAKTGP